MIAQNINQTRYDFLSAQNGMNRSIEYRAELLEMENFFLRLCRYKIISLEIEAHCFVLERDFKVFNQWCFLDIWKVQKKCM